MDIAPTTYDGLKCADCQETFSLVSAVGPSNICPACGQDRAGEIFAPFPVPGDRVSCGLRTDLPKRERRHESVSLGVDTRHYGALGEFIDMEVSACVKCGRDKVQKIKG